MKDVQRSSQTISLEPGATLVLYTDGVTEAQNAANDLFGMERLLAIIRANAGKSANQMHAAILGAKVCYLLEAKGRVVFRRGAIVVVTSGDAMNHGMAISAAKAIDQRLKVVKP